MSEVIYFNGQPLPPLREGKVWGIKIWFGGRLELRQYKPELLQTTGQALKNIRENGFAYVWLDDASYVVSRWKHEQESNTVTS